MIHILLFLLILLDIFAFSHVLKNCHNKFKGCIVFFFTDTHIFSYLPITGNLFPYFSPYKNSTILVHKIWCRVWII